MMLVKSNAYPPLANVQIPVSSRVLSVSCCPDKDLLLLVSRLGGLDRISLWHSNSGAKVWEADLGGEGATVEVQGIAWSPDGHSLACLSHPPRLSLHSIKDGRIITTLPVTPAAPNIELRLSAVWWFPPMPKASNTPSIPDIFKRNNVVTGTAESILKSLPYLDALAEDSDKLSATNLFAFQGSQTRTHTKFQLPHAINTWPTLSLDSTSPAVDSSIQHQASVKPEASLDEKDDSNVNSILMVSDTLGNVYSYLDGAFPLGVIRIGHEAPLSILQKSSVTPVFFGHASFRGGAASQTQLRPTVIGMPLLVDRRLRDFARLSSIARDLTWYIMRVIKEMKEAWYGGESSTGARELGPHWVDALKTTQKEKFGHRTPDPMWDLTQLLTTGRPSDALADFLGSGEQMSERGIQRWESIMSDALAKLRDHADKRLVPAFQRLHLVLEELDGWQSTPSFAVFRLGEPDLRDAIETVARGIVLAGWLSAIARRELHHFKHFILWLRFESSNMNAPSTAEGHPTPRHDILEVNGYFMSGLMSSRIDLWFEGELPKFEPRDLGVPEPGDGPLDDVLDRATKAALNPPYLDWQSNITQNDHRSIERNLVALGDHLAARCNFIFRLGAGAPSRSAQVSRETFVPSEPLRTQHVLRQRIIEEAGGFHENYLAHVRQHNIMVYIRFAYDGKLAMTDARIILFSIQCSEDASKADTPTILAADFFDHRSVVVVYRVNREAFISLHEDTPEYAGQLTGVELPFQKEFNLEDLVQGAIDQWKMGHLPANPMILHRRRLLIGCRHGDAELAVNGRKQRRIACVLDSQGSRLETFDLGEENDEMEAEEDGEVEGEEEEE